MAPKIVLGTPQRTKQVIVYDGLRGETTRKFIDEQWITFPKGVPIPVPGHWAVALKRLGSFNDYDGSPIPEAPVYSIIRNMGMGDVILATTTVTAMKRQWPWATVRYYVDDRYLPIFRNREQDFELHGLSEPPQGNVQFDLRGVSERNSDRFSVERIDIYARHAGVILPDNMRAPVVKVSPEQEQHGEDVLKEHGWTGRPLLGIQVVSSRSERDLAPSTVENVALYWMAKGWEVVIFHNEPLTYNGGIVNMTGGTDIETLVNCVANCRLFLGVDSGITHLAGGLNIPTLALTGPIRGQLRYACYPSVRIMQKDDMMCVQRPHECYSARCGGNKCMEFSAEEINAGLEGML